MIEVHLSSPVHLHQTYRHFDLLVDSRRLLDPGRTLFFALPGRRVDGHAYVAELYGRGVRHFVVHGGRRGSFRLPIFRRWRT